MLFIHVVHCVFDLENFFQDFINLLHLLSDSILIKIRELGPKVSHFFGFLLAILYRFFDFFNKSFDSDFVLELSSSQITINLLAY